jgi:anti-sigma B factor antagonist
MKVEQAGELTVVRFTLAEIMHVEVIASVGDALFALVEDEGRRVLLLDLGAVRNLSSAMMGKLVALHRKLLALDGRLALCRINPEVQRTFDLCQLPRLLHIYPTEEEALRALGSAPPAES